MRPTTLNGSLLCARYAFAPNFFHYCGPDTKGEIGEYIAQETADKGLVEHLSRFETMYPYLVTIAQANGMADPLDWRVVDAYWIGNRLLDQVNAKWMEVAMVDMQHLPKRLSRKEMRWLLPKIDQQARLTHSFHVFNVFSRTGHVTVDHTVETMDSCRISWGKIVAKKPLGSTLNIEIESQQLVYMDGKMLLVPLSKEVQVSELELGRTLQIDDWVSVHWGFVCSSMTVTQVKRLAKDTAHHIDLANSTL